LDYIISSLMERVEAELTRSRYVHTLGVAYTAGSLAMRYSLNVERAVIAGLLHDCAKCISFEEQISMCRENGVALTDTELQNPKLIHAKLGAYLAKAKYNIDDEEILSSIKFHTTGRPDMSMLEKIVYIADYIEPKRHAIDRLDEIRAMAFTDIDKAMLMILENTLSHLKADGRVIDKTTKDTYDFYNK